jgi:proteasome accessory factor C
MCGLPGYGPGDLIDLSFEGDTVTVTFDAGMRRPLRLSGAEATALVVALRALSETPGLVDAGAVRRALAKIEVAAGQADGVVVGLATREEAALASVRDALDRRRALHIRYYTPARWSTLAATWRPGAVARRKCDCSGSTESRMSRRWMSQRIPHRTLAPPTCPGGCSVPNPTSRSPYSPSPRMPVGLPSITRWTN